MNSIHIFTAAIFASSGAYAQTAQAPDAAGAQPMQQQAQPVQQQAQPAGAEPHQHRYVTIGRDRTRVHLDRPAERSGRSTGAMGKSDASSASPAGPPSRGEGQKGGPN